MISETHEAIIPSDAKRSRRIPRSHRKLSHRIGSGAFAPNALGLLCSLDLARNDVYIRRLMPHDISLTCPAANSRSSKSAQTSRDQGYGRSLSNCSPRLLVSSSGVNGGICNVLWSIPRKTKSLGAGVFRPSRRSKSSKLCSPRHGTDTNGAVGKKWPTRIRPVQKRQISVSTNNRARLNHCMRDYSKTMPNGR